MNTTSYGRPGVCPDQWFLEVDKPSVYTNSGYATLAITPVLSSTGSPIMAPPDCGSATMSLAVYKHTSSGDWTLFAAASYGAQLVGSDCVFGPSDAGIFQNLGGGATSDVDQVRVLVGGVTKSGADVPFFYDVQACNPLTCASAGVTCGTIADGCGGTVRCGPACTMCNGTAHPKSLCSAPWHCCGTDGWQCGLCR